MEHRDHRANPLAQIAHDKADAAIDHAREVREKKLADLARNKPEPCLIADGNLQRCSGGGYPFPADVRPSMNVAFAEHLMKAHKSGQTSEDANQSLGESVSLGNDKRSR
jgi:hypothetical protein